MRTTSPRRAARRSVTALALAGATLGALALGARAASAQVNPIRLGISGGAALPTGDFGDIVNTGYSVGAFVAVRPPVSPLGLRGEVSWSSFGFQGNTDANYRILAGTVNAVLNIGTAPVSPVRPYLIGGVGAYRQSVSGDNTTINDATRLGLNGGIGLDIPLTGLGVFVEARYTTIFNEKDEDGNRRNTNFVPISVGIRF
jgi:opacity protein-like surface antigen